MLRLVNANSKKEETDVWNHGDLGVILCAVEVYVLLLVSYLLWESYKDKDKVYFKCKR